VVAAAVIGGVATLGGAAASVSATNKASKAAKKAAAANNTLQADTYSQNKAVLAPYVGAGNTATPAIQALLGLSGDASAQEAALNQFRNASGYQDQFAEGQRSITSALGNRGLLDSGAAQKSLVKYGQMQANGSFGDYLSRLVQQQGVGMGAASAQAGVGQNYANAVSANNNASANAVGNAALSNANTINGALQSGLSAYALGSGMKSSYSGGTNGIVQPTTPVLGGGYYNFINGG